MSSHYSDKTQANLEKVTRERDQLRREKEEEVMALNSKLHTMERSYEAILQVYGIVYTVCVCVCGVCTLDPVYIGVLNDCIHLFCMSQYRMLWMFCVVRLSLSGRSGTQNLSSLNRKQNKYCWNLGHQYRIIICVLSVLFLSFV